MFRFTENVSNTARFADEPLRISDLTDLHGGAAAPPLVGNKSYVRTK